MVGIGSHILRKTVQRSLHGARDRGGALGFSRRRAHDPDITCRSYALEVILAMHIEWTEQFDAYLTHLEEESDRDEVAKRRLSTLGALLTAVRDLDGPLTGESATFKRVRQSQRIPLWRVAHPYDPHVAVRLIIWFPSDESVVLVVSGFDKATLGDIWYDRAVAESTAIIASWLRANSTTGR